MEIPAHKHGGCTLADVRRGVCRVATTLGLLLAPFSIAAQESTSATLAGELVKLLDARKLDSIAARAEAADQFVGALYFPSVQLLVVTARYAVPQRMEAYLALQKYREIYLNLNSASIPESKIFVSDLGADGLRARRQDERPADTTDIGGRSYAFDGDWDRAKLSEEEYTKAFRTTDQEYVRMLEALVAELKKPS